MTTTFTGIPLAALDFYEGLEDDNSRSYWTAHAADYERHVRGPLTALGDTLADELGELRLFRPYRDVRFSRDKSPYKTAQGAWFERGGYVQVGAAGLAVGVGYYRMEPDQVSRYRAAVDEARTGEELSGVVAAVRASGHQVAGDQLRTRPRGVDADHPRLDLLRFRTLYSWHDFGAPEWLPTPAAAAHVRTALREMAPLRDWLDRHVGPSDQPRR
jgi:uncharacterized protein (TIGR02453 family)